MAGDSTNSVHQAPDEEIERLAQEIGRLIKNADPQKREELKELAFTLIREEVFERSADEKSEAGTAPGPFNPLGTGVLILILGAGLSFVFGPVGLTLMLGGLIFIVWGAVISWAKG